MGRTDNTSHSYAVLDDPVPGNIAPANSAISYNPLDYGIPLPPETPPIQKEPTFFQKAWTILINALMKWFR